MMLEHIKNTLHQEINELFAAAAVDELSGDTAAYQKKLEDIAKIAKVLNINMEIVTVSLNIKPAQDENSISGDE